MVAALRRCLRVVERSARAYATAAERAVAEDLRLFLEAVAAERERFVVALRDLLGGLGAWHATGAETAPDGEALPDLAGDGALISSCDGVERDAQRTYEVCRSTLAGAEVPRPIRQVVDVQYAAVCNARFHLARHLASRRDGGVAP